jgi:hypothetical protein
MLSCVLFFTGHDDFQRAIVQRPLKLPSQTRKSLLAEAFQFADAVLIPID